MRSASTSLPAVLTGVLGACAVLFGAFGAHALRDRLGTEAMGWWHTAVEYQFWHVLALGVAATLGDSRPRKVATWAFAWGVLLFSGSLYALALGAPRSIGVLTPLGGVAFLLGWVALAVALRRR